MTLAVREDGSPDWEEIEEEVSCPLCEYLLRGLIEPRCPECGYRFDWPDLLDPTRRLHPYLFEHHPERNGESFRRTLLGGFRPRRFWTSLHPVQPSCLRRLVVYWCLAAVPIVAAPTATAILVATSMARDNASFYQRIGARPVPSNSMYVQDNITEYGSLQAWFDAEYPMGIVGCLRSMLSDGEFLAGMVLPVAVVLAWPWLTFLALLLFAISMRQAKVNRMHVLRSVLYSFDVVLWIALGQLLMIFFMLLAQGVRLTVLTLTGPGALVALTVLLLIFGSFRLWTAYRLYLRFNRPFATVLASQIIVFLIASNCILFVAIY